MCAIYHMKIAHAYMYRFRWAYIKHITWILHIAYIFDHHVDLHSKKKKHSSTKPWDIYRCCDKTHMLYANALLTLLMLLKAYLMSISLMGNPAIILSCATVSMIDSVTTKQKLLVWGRQYWHPIFDILSHVLTNRSYHLIKLNQIGNRLTQNFIHTVWQLHTVSI